MFSLLTRTVASFDKQCYKFGLKIRNFSLCQYRAFEFSSAKMNETSLSNLAKQLAPPLTNDRHKGQAGRIGIFGGSIEYTGAPYFAAISSLKVGSDLVYVFCPKNAAPVIKSYSPELIVLPHLDEADAIKKIDPWIDRLHVVLIGPGLGRETTTFNVIEEVINACKAKNKPLVIDADGLYLVSIKRHILLNYPAPVILTPNAMEFLRLIGSQENGDGNKLQLSANFVKELGGQITLLCKDHEDDIISNQKSVKVKGGGSGRRCGGQGDVLSGAVSSFLAWALEKPKDNSLEDVRPAAACFAAAKLVRECNARAFVKYGRSMVCTDMIKEICEVFRDNFELK